MYRSEQKFSQAILPLLQKQFRLVQRIESGETGRGIPDIYCRNIRGELWIELKNDYRQSIYTGAIQVHWRPGQQAWHYNYYKASGYAVLTIVAMKDGFILIPLKKRFIHNIVPINDCYICSELKDISTIIPMVMNR